MSTRSKDSLKGGRLLTADDLSQINRAAIRNFRGVLSWLLPDGRIESGEYVVRNPKRDDRRAGSFKIRATGEKTGVWSDFATDERGSDPISLVAAYIKDTSRQEAGRVLQRTLRNLQSAGLSEGDPRSARKREGRLPAKSDSKIANVGEPIEFICPPKTAESHDRALARLPWSKPDQKWLYRTAEGAKAFYVLRWDLQGKKQIRPLSYCRTADSEGWRSRAWPKNRPLYKLPDLLSREDARIIVCEGEKAADAAAKLFPKTAVSTTSSGGAGASTKTDWSPLAFRNVLIWPDADESGLAYSHDVGRALDALGCKVSVIDATALAGELLTAVQERRSRVGTPTTRSRIGRTRTPFERRSAAANSLSIPVRAISATARSR